MKVTGWILSEDRYDLQKPGTGMRTLNEKKNGGWPSLSLRLEGLGFRSKDPEALRQSQAVGVP